MRIINWNVRWANTKSKWGPTILKEIQVWDPEVACITESYSDFLADGHTITSYEDYGYKITPGRRKVMLWSKKSWRDVDTLGDESLPGGRFVSGITNTSLGEIQFIGICIPWRDAHVRTGRKDREIWEDHLAYLDGLKVLLAESSDTPTILLGDFNERIPRSGQPIKVFDQLIDTIPNNMNIATTGLIPEIEKQTIDHVCHTGDLMTGTVSAINNETKDGVLMSDHFGINVDFRRS